MHSIAYTRAYTRRMRPRRIPIRTDRRRFYKDPWDPDELELEIGCPIDKDEANRNDRG
jgi:hypothetical protein